MSLQAMQQDLEAARNGRLDLSGLAKRLRAAEVPSALPQQYSDVLGQITDSIEASALFSGESCSFSEGDLLNALQAWLDKAQAKLAQ